MLNDVLQDLLDEGLQLLGEHLVLVFSAILIASAIAIPLGLAVAGHPRTRNLALGLANIGQTIPSLALFGFLIPIPFIRGDWGAYGDYCAGDLCAAADSAEYGDGDSGGGWGGARFGGGDGDDARADSADGGIAAGGADDSFGAADRDGDDGGDGDDCGGDRRGGAGGVYFQGDCVGG